jgi:hypothetical protein
MPTTVTAFLTGSLSRLQVRGMIGLVDHFAGFFGASVREKSCKAVQDANDIATLQPGE